MKPGKAATPQALAKSRRVEAIISALILCATAAVAGAKGFGALVAVFVLLLFAASRIKGRARFFLPPVAGFVGAMLGALIRGSTFIPRGRTTWQHFTYYLGDSILGALVIGVTMAGLAGIILLTVIQWSGKLQTMPRIVREGRGLLIGSIVYFIVASVAIPEFGDVRVRIYEKQMQSDLRNLAYSQEKYHDSTGSFARAIEQLRDFKPSTGNHITLTEATSSAWAATVTSDVLSTTCTGEATSPQLEPFNPDCTQRRRWF